jgi:hypothetical protein
MTAAGCHAHPAAVAVRAITISSDAALENVREVRALTYASA